MASCLLADLLLWAWIGATRQQFRPTRSHLIMQCMSRKQSMRLTNQNSSTHGFSFGIIERCSAALHVCRKTEMEEYYMLDALCRRECTCHAFDAPVDLSISETGEHALHRDINHRRKVWLRYYNTRGPTSGITCLDESYAFPHSLVSQFSFTSKCYIYNSHSDEGRYGTVGRLCVVAAMCCSGRGSF